MARNKTSMNIYACGGLGTAVVSSLNKSMKEDEADEYHSDTNLYYVDTSNSDLTDEIKKENVYLIPGLDGSGKKRSTNHEIVADNVNDILLNFKPSDVNIVIHSASGGSGSVIGPVIASELLSRGCLVIVITAGSSSSKIEVNNTINTLKSYEKISQLRKLPVILNYHENSAEHAPAKVDNNIKTIIVLLSCLFSGTNRKLDSADLNNFLNYHNVTSYEPRLASLELFKKVIDTLKGRPLISLVTLAGINDVTDPNVAVEYQAVGFPSDDLIEQMSKDLPIHFGIIGGAFTDIINRLSTVMESYEEIRKAAKSKPIASSDDSSTNEGLVL